LPHRLALLAFSPSAEADFAKKIVDASTGDDLGSITFPAVTGSSPAGLTFDLGALRRPTSSRFPGNSTR
jgi:hypothetical protein